MTARRVTHWMVLAGCLSGCDNQFQERLDERYAAGPRPGHPAPAYAAVSLSGDTVHLDSFRGRAVLLNVWATWCGPCVEEFPDLIELDRRLGPMGLVIIGVTIDRERSEPLQDFLARHGVPWLNLKDTESNLSEVFGWTRGVPKSLLLDRSGRVVAFWWGRLDPFTERNQAFLSQALAVDGAAADPSQGGPIALRNRR